MLRTTVQASSVNSAAAKSSSRKMLSSKGHSLQDLHSLRALPCVEVRTWAETQKILFPGTTAMPAFVRNVLAAVPTMGEGTGSFLGERGCSRMALISVTVVRFALLKPAIAEC